MTIPERSKDAEGRWRVGRNWLGQNEFGLYEVYIHGEDLDRGSTYGSLARELIERQEMVFLDRIQAMIPSGGKLQFLKYFSAWFNRDMDEYVPEEYQREIYGVSRSFSDQYDAVGPKFIRALNYHAAHDIGHALQDLALVGCTSFAAWGERTTDSSLLVARNFDFWMGPEFARDKLITFIDPEDGIPHVLVTWGGFMGATSAMNLEGLTVTINASRSELPAGARMPISLLARMIVQYASTIDEAVAIAAAHDVFVSESIMVSSAKDGRAAIIEKAPDSMDVWDPRNEMVVCANHYQGELFFDSEPNQANIRESDSMRRFRRMLQLVDSVGLIDPTSAVAILRDQRGLDGADLGMGDPGVINQLLAHHAVVFLPEERRIWVSNTPYQCGAFVGYDLRDVFERCKAKSFSGPAHDPNITIAEDPFIRTPEFAAHERWLTARMRMTEAILTGASFVLSTAEEEQFIRDNPRSWLTFAAIGDLRKAQGNDTAACAMYRRALQLPISAAKEKERMNNLLEECH